MRTLILLFLLITTPVLTYRAFGQTYTTESKSCGSCNKEVSKDSKIGMRCPHCGVRWGYENEQRTTSTRYVYDDYNSDEYKTSGFTTSRVNLRSEPSTKSSIKTVIPSYTSLPILHKSGNWYYVEYTYFNGYTAKSIKGYVHKSLL